LLSIGNKAESRPARIFGLSSAMTPKLRKYAIKVTDMVSRKDVIFTVVGWTDEEKRAAVAQILRLAGAPEEVGRDLVNEVEPPESPRKH
jgi:hypothetical protein